MSYLSITRNFWKPFLRHKMLYLMVSKNKIHYLFGDGIDKSYPRDHCCHHSESLVMPISDPWERFFHHILTFMMDSYCFIPGNKPEELSTTMIIVIAASAGAVVGVTASVLVTVILCRRYPFSRSYIF